MRAERRALAAAAASFALDAGAVAVAVIAAAGPLPRWPVAALLHLCAVAAAASLSSEPSRRQLAVAMVFTLPVLGAALAATAALVPGRGRDELLPRRGWPRQRETGVVVARRLVAGVPICESLLGDPESRRAALAALQRESDARAVALLRWAVNQPDPDLGVEAALALEELSTRSSRRAADACTAMERQPCRDNALAAAQELAAPIHNGLAEPSLVTALADQARSYYERAAALDPARAGELAAPRARLELAVLRPEVALALLEPALQANPGDGGLRALYREAAHASRRFELLPGGAYGTAGAVSSGDAEVGDDR